MSELSSLTPSGNLYSFNLSILEDNPQALDKYEPVTFLTWFSNKNLINFNFDEMFSEYRNYVVAWGKKKNLTKQQQADTVRDAYIQVLRDIVINYTTEEERRFVTNANFSDPYDLDVIIPFFIKKLKQVCLYYVGKREEVKTASVQHNLRGSNFGIRSLIKKLIFDAADTNQYYYSFATNFFPPVSALAKDVDVYVEELYDTSSEYFNINPLSADFAFANTSAERKALSSSNLNSIDYQLYIDFKGAIVTAIQQYPLFIESLGTNNFTINIPLSGTELYYLKNRDFIEYLSGGQTTLKLAVQRALAPKYMGTDFYYLQTGSTTTNFVSGLLFSVAPPDGAPTLNLLNKNYPTVATTPALNSLYTEYEIGKFFVPTYLGLLIYNTPEKKFAINTDKLKPNTVYVFPDPDVVGNVSYNSQYEDANYPLVYEVDVTWNKVSRSNQFKFGDVLSNSYKQLFYGYESQQQDLQKNIAGVSKAEDNVQFWTGEKQETWANPDIWPDLKSQEYLDYESRQSSLMVNDLTLVKWTTDIFNNEYGLYKKVASLQSISGVEYDGSIIQGTNTVITDAAPFAEKTVYQKKNSTPGILFFRNNFTSVVQPASAALNLIFKKYPAAIYNELVSGIYKFNLYGNVILLETDNYIVIDKINFDYERNQIIPMFNPGNYFVKKDFQNNFEMFVNEWYSEEENHLYLCFLKLRPALSASNYKVLYPKIYRTELNTLQFREVYPSKETDLNSYYSISAGFIEPPQIDIRKIDGAHFSRVERTNTFNLTYLAKNNNSIPFFVNEQFVQTEPYLTSIAVKMFKPFYFIYDNNYSNPTLPFLVKYSNSLGSIAGTHDNKSKFTFAQENHNYTVYYFNDSVTPTQINNTGISIVQFDWQSYNQTTVFVGCSAFYVKNIDNKLIWNYGTSEALLLNEYGTTYKLFETPAFDAEGNTFQAIVTVKRPVYPDPSILQFEVYSQQSQQSGKICSEPASIYRSINLSVAGAGTGIILTDPPCMLCGDDCSEVFPINTTLTLIASADRISKFSYWVGSTVDGQASPDQELLITSTSSITAVFDALPIYSVTVFAGPGHIISFDGFIDCPEVCRYNKYLASDYVVLSALDALSGYALYGFLGVDVDYVQQGNNIVRFFTTKNLNISANYIRVLDYNVGVTLSATAQASNLNESYGQVISLPAGIDVTVPPGGGTATANATFSGTQNNIYGGSTILTLSARSNPGYSFKQWANGSIDGNTAPVTQFAVGQDYNDLLALFDLGNYTLTLTFDGDGLGTFFSDDLGLLFTSAISGDAQSFGVLNTTPFTLSLSALSGSLLLGVNRVVTQTLPGVSSCDIVMNNNINVVALLSAIEFFILNVVRTGTACGSVSSADLRIRCGTGAGSCSAEYVRGALVELGVESLPGGCTFEKFVGDNILFKYNAGDGIVLNSDTVTLANGENFGLVNNSITITNPAEGAYFAAGTGITITSKNCFVPMTSYKEVSAIFA